MRQALTPGPGAGKTSVDGDLRVAQSREPV